PGGFTTPAEYEVTFTYPSGVVQSVRSHPNYIWNGSRKSGIPKAADRGPNPKTPPDDAHGVTFTGADGWIFVTRGKIEASDPDLLKQELPASATRLAVSTNHAGNFFDACRTRQDPVCPVETGHRSVSACHLAVIGARLGRPLTWDPEAERFTSDDEANGLLAREMRKPWSYDTV
ncbi:MAG: oxidoreductase domain protein, partial [Phycisphaerales bacterium]|nr:oxidoreductase domain protein [Phycisphaerales bacterium]